MAAPRFIIWTGQWDETSGGTIALHTLCHRLNAHGARAALWPDYKPLRRNMRAFAFAVRALAYAVRGRRRFATGPFDNPVARTRDLRGAVIVYPEIVAGNPLGAGTVVRWLLHRPGHHTGTVDYGERDLHFFYQPAFDDPTLNRDGDNWLRVTYINPVYRQTNLGERQGTCYIVRKGAGRVLDRHPPDAVPIDALGHEEKAAVFNRCRILYTYDPYTLYTFYASICGCVAVFLPEDGVSVTDVWPGERPAGLAYGEEELDWAADTRPQLLENLERDLEEEAHMIDRFIAKCAAAFERPS